MIISALWYLDQWNKNPLGGGLSRGIIEHHPDYAPFAVPYAAATGLAPAIVVGGSPYSLLQSATMGLEDYIERNAYSGSKFSVKGSEIVFARSARKRMFLKGAAKLGTRFIPYVGWGLLAYDLWNVGKWIGHKTS